MLTSLKNLKEDEVNGIVRLLDAFSKFCIMITFCIILLFIVGFFVYGVVAVEQPMKDMAPNDKLTHDLLKIIATSIFSVLAVVMGARAMMPLPNMNPCAGMMPGMMPGMQPMMGMNPMMGMQPAGVMSAMNTPWVPPPPPKTPPTLESEEERLRTAHARESTRV
jgi:hypothetical protein